jgi:hypothetical protein
MNLIVNMKLIHTFIAYWKTRTIVLWVVVHGNTICAVEMIREPTTAERRIREQPSVCERK